ncbi:NlpC/P60 family protein [Clostridium nigeriense]|uniref:NlpC/P60 family protein n=1 Tax=Clostridium nigeriense TaxID=1805470 RepID=UPI003D35011A
MINKKLKRFLTIMMITAIFSSAFLVKEAKAYNAGGDGKVKINSWDINNFNSTADLWTQNITSYTPEKVTDRMTTGDFNGDGKDEMVAFYDYGSNNTRIHMLSENGGSYSYSTPWVSETGNFYAPSITGRVVSGDFDGNGKDEIMALYYHYDTTATMFQFSLDNNTQKFSANSVWKATGVDADHMAAMVAGDFDGDGKDEILLFYDYENNVTGMFEIKMGSDGKLTSRKAWESKTYNASKIKGKTVAGDFNGDGKDEVAMFYDYGNATTKIWTLNYENNNYAGIEKWYTSDFDASKITDKVVATHNKNGTKDKIIALYDYANNETGVFTWELQSNNNFSSVRHGVISNYEAERVIGRVAVGKFDGQTTRLIAMYDGTVVQSQTKGERVVAEAKKHLGVPYLWGGTTPSGFDCSGLTQYVYREATGIDISRTTYTQRYKGISVSYSNLQVGDLVFTNNYDHVGIYVGNGQMIHSPDEGDVVKISNIYNFVEGRRIL